MKTFLVVALWTFLVGVLSANSTLTLGARLNDLGEIETVDITEITSQLEWMWDNTNAHEWLGCLLGEYDEQTKTLKINGIELSIMKGSSPSRVEGICNRRPETVGTIHPHSAGMTVFGGKRDGNCELSDNDIRSFGDNDSFAFSLVQCKRNAVLIPDTKVRFKRVTVRGIVVEGLDSIG